MKSSLIVFAVLLAAFASHAQQIEVSPKSRPHTRDATVGYSPTKVEAGFDAKNPDVGGDNGFGAAKAGTLLGYQGKLVSWFGIVREVPAAAGGTYLIENKYFDGLNDFHIQLASLYGAGDFRVTAADPKGAIKRLCLVRIIGTVTDEKDGVPTVKADYVRVWNLGDYTFMDYGVDASAERWKKLRQKMDLIYNPSPDAAYYEKLLGK
ncbi:hypothetical protein [Prosthecobacter sp.]|uniref:hypothetical protein n=1 Tax=Prosthecobacter sp. TaxID=1965333 RepID=UPI003784AB8C